MPPARPVFPGSFLFITRRCTQRQFVLRPDAETNNAFTYCLADAARRTGVTVILSQMESNHHHTAAYDPLGQQVEFREHLHKMMAKSQNALRGRWENLWSAEEPCTVEVMSAEDLLDKLVYIATNPVKDGLVEKVRHWPGPNFVKALLTGKPMKATRPRHFFRTDGPMPAAPGQVNPARSAADGLRAVARRRLAGPALERPDERRGLGVAEQERDLADGQRGVLDEQQRALAARVVE